jgi:protoporphyrinogen oxidase
MKKNRITIIGGGIAGISAAIHLIEKGHIVSVIEAKKFIGGRAGSIKVEDTFIDIGQHVFLSSYQNFIHIIKTLNLEKKFILNKILNIPVSTDKKTYYIKSNIIKYPFSILFGVINYKNLNLINRFKLIYGLAKLKLAKKSINDSSFLQWLKINKQNDQIIEKFWKIICTPAFNIDIDKISYNSAINLFNYMIFNSKNTFFICYAKESFQNIFMNSFTKYLKKNNSNIHFGIKIESIENKKNGIIKINAKKKIQFETENLILATDYESTSSILGIVSNENQSNRSAIINIYFWFDSIVMHEDFKVFTDSKIEWVFSDYYNKKNKDTTQRLIISLSDANKLLKHSNEDLINSYEQEVGKQFDIEREVETTKSLVIRSPKATVLTNRKINNQLKSVFVCGDWTIEELPNTMEAAALSGKKISEKYF